MPPSPSTNLPADAGPVLLALARAAVAAELGVPASPPEAAADWLRRPGASFVTLTIGGRLRGCIGTLRPVRPLADDVAVNSCNAAFRDRRFPRLTGSELERTRFEVSVLSDTVPMPVTGVEDAVARLRPGVDGVLLEYPGHRATFLPQVWEMTDGAEDLLRLLRRKAGLPPDFWHPDLRLSRYTVTSYEEPQW